MINDKKTEIMNVFRSLMKVNLNEEIFSYKEFQEFLISERISFLKISYLPKSNKILLITNETTKSINEMEISISLYKNKPEVSFETFFYDVDMTYTKNHTQLICNEINSLNSYTGYKNAFESIKERLIIIDKKSKLQEICRNEDKFEMILSPEEEIEFWKSINNSNPNERSKTILGAFLKIEKYFSESFGISSENINEVFTQVIGCCEDIIQDITIIPKMNFERLKNFLAIAIESLTNRSEICISKFKFLEQNSQSKLLEFQKAFRNTIERVETLNKLFFKLNKNKECEIQVSLSKQLNKLNEIIEIKSLYNETNKLLNNSIEIPLDINITTVTPNNELKSEIKKRIENYQSEIIQKLNEEIFSGGHIIPTLREMQNWKAIFSQSNITSMTLSKREILLKEICDYIIQTKANFDSKNINQASIEDILAEHNNNISNINGTTNITQNISQIIWAHTLRQKVEISKKLSNVLRDLTGYTQFINSCDSLISEISIYTDNLINDWKSTWETPAHTQGHQILLLPKNNTNLIEMNTKTGLLTVNVSERLFLLIQDIRVLIEYGYVSNIPKELLKINEEGKKILKEAASLKQIANFYNNLSSQVIQSQKPMLVQNAREFESNLFILQERSKMKATNPNNTDLENFVNLVQVAANDLTKEIRRMKKSHCSILDLLTQLLNYDLISHKSKWKEILKRSRNIFNEVCERYSDNLMTKEWKNHWNFQLYKILKIQFSLSLDKFFLNVTEVECEFIINKKELFISPPLEDLKKIIYKEIKSFISIPTLIKGFLTEDDQDNNQNYISYYHNLINNSTNSIKINKLYENLNLAINKLEDLRLQCTEIIGLSYLDYESYIENNFNTMNDWKYNFDILKKKLRELSLMEDYIKIDCFKINLKNYKIFVDDIFEKIFEILSVSLKEKLKIKVNHIDEFIKNGMQTLTFSSKSPQSMQEIILFKQNYIDLARKKFEYKKLCDDIDEMNKLLTNISGQNVNLNGLESRWVNFDTMMGSFSEMIEDQKANIRGQLNTKLHYFNDKLEKFYSKYQASVVIDTSEFTDQNYVNEIALNIKLLYNQWNEHEIEIQNFINECINFDIEVPNVKNFNSIKNEISENKLKWDLFFAFTKDLEIIQVEEWMSIRHKAYNILQDFVLNWQDKIKKKEKDFIYIHINYQIERLKSSLSVYKFLIGDNFERDHWKSLFNLLKFDNNITKENLKFSNFIDKTEFVLKKSNEIKELYTRAQGEILIRNAMSELITWFETAEFVFYETGSNNRKTPLIKEWKDLMNDISEKQALLISVKSSEYFDRFVDQIEQFEIKFSNLDIWLSNLNLIQRKWIYLEPILFTGSLPKEQQRFKKIDDEFRSIMLRLNTDNKVSSIFTINGIKNTLEMLIDQLEKCQKALNDFLEDKRNKFARLYFLGDEDLLEFLAKSKDKYVIKSNLKKLYQGITNINCNNDGNGITHIESALGEKVKLKNEILITDELEKWLDNLTFEMHNTLALNLTDGIKVLNKGTSTGTPTTTLEIFIESDNYSTQICGLVELINFTNLIESTFSAKCKFTDLIIKITKYIEVLTILQSKHFSSPVILFKIKNIILDMIHTREIINLLNDSQVTNMLDWNWYSQLKYSWIETKSGNACAKVSMCNSYFNYTYEYQGACPRLVHTPLTDKCYLTLTQALRLGYGGNPYGPAGTGKTESVKALGLVLGRQVLVFNCDEGIDFKAMGRIFIGLVKSGAWGCFDEFNRLLEEQLSAISIQIQIIQFALKNQVGFDANANEAENKKNQPHYCNILNQNVLVNPNSAIFVTLNPAGKGYGGRSKLPDNLKALFRPVAMSVPDNQQIAETLLSAEGFKNSAALARKIVTLFTLCKQSLSYQQHYDWGLRALKTILTVANQQIVQGRSISFEEEIEILIKSIRINTLSKLTFDDVTKFNLLINDVFPGVKINDLSYEELNEALVKAYDALKYEFIDEQFKKVIQFYEACRQRMGVVLVGPSGCGKSTIWRLLKHAYTYLKQDVNVHIINPKSMPRNLLLGHMNHDTGEYSYGVLTKCARDVEKENADTKCWIICDGDVDPEWIEALNSVLDDNRLLTMQNGERINFGANVNFIFETDSLQFASPATISRMGIIYMNQEDLDIRSIVNSYVKKLNCKNADNLIENYFFEIYNLFISSYEMMLKTTSYGMIHNFFSLAGGKLDNKARLTDALIKGLGANLNYEARKRFANEIYRITQEKPQNNSNPLNNFYDNISETIKEYTLNDNTSLNVSMNANKLVKTQSNQRDLDTLKLWLDGNEPFIIVGPAGCGKNMIINQAIEQLKSCQVSVISATSQTNASNVIQKLIQSCVFSNNSRGRCLRPKESHKLILHIKDINLPKPDRYHTIQLISFFQQIVTYQGFYDDNLEFIHLERIQIIGSMNPSSTVGRYEITTRLTGNVRILYIDNPTKEELEYIYQSYLKVIIDSRALSSDLDSLCKPLIESSISIFYIIKESFTPDEHRHYIFTPRDLSGWILSLSRYDIQSTSELIEVWVYECCRIFRDKLVNQEHKHKFDVILQKALVDKINKMCSNSISNPNSNKIFSSLGGKGCSNRLVNTSKEDYIELLQKGRLIYERDNSDLFIDFTDEVLYTMKQIDRILSNTSANSNILLIGENSIGRKKAVKIISSALNFEIVSLTLYKDYGVKEFKKSVKDIFTIAGMEGRSSVMIIEKHQIQKNEILQYINCLLSSGEVPGLFTNEESEAMISAVMNDFKEQNEYRNTNDFFNSRIRKYLKIVILLDRDDKDYSSFLINNPALVVKCQVIYWPEFSNTAMAEYARSELRDAVQCINPRDVNSIIDSFVQIHQSCKENSLTATHAKFIELVGLFKILIKDKIGNSTITSKHLQNGLNKLIEAEKFVEELSVKSKHQKSEIEKKSNEANASLKMIQDSMTMSTNKKINLEYLSKVLEEDTIQVEQNKSKVEEELKEVLPEVEKAKNLVKSLDSAALAEIRAFFKQPVLRSEVYNVLKAMLQLIGYSDLSSEGVKSNFNMEAISTLRNFDVKKLTKENAKKVMSIVSSNPGSFDKTTMTRISYSLAQIAEYVNALIRFYVAKENIKPLENALEEAEMKFLKSKSQLDSNKNELQAIDDQIEDYKNNFANKMGEAEVLKIEYNKTEELLTKARSLLSKLTQEKTRWQAQIDELKIQNEMIPFNCILSSAFITYLGYYNESIRELMVSKWTDYITTGITTNSLALTPVTRFLITESQRLQLKSLGLATDDLSMENAVILQNTIKTSYIIDPTSRALDWFKKSMVSADKTLEIVSTGDTKLLTCIELSIRFGKFLILTDVDVIEPYLIPLIRKEYTKRGPTNVVKIGDKVIDLHDRFKLFLSTRDSQVEISNNVLSSLSVVNFSVTRSGLESLLLALTIDIEQPELERNKNQLLFEQDEIKLELSKIEKLLLDELINLEGNLLDNKNLIMSLEASKEKSINSENSLKNSILLSEEIECKRNIYKPLAKVATVIYILLQDLYKINPMYQFSLNNFISLFKKTIQNGYNNLSTGKSSNSNKIELYINQLTKSAFVYYSRAIFKTDLLVFGLYYIKTVFGNSKNNEWEFLSGNFSYTANNSVRYPPWLNDERKEIYSVFVENFPDLSKKIIDSKNLGETWYQSTSPETELDVIIGISSLQRLILINVFRPDRLESAMRNFICETLNLQTINPPSISLPILLEETQTHDEITEVTPILFVTTLGSDPSKELEDYAYETVGIDNYIQIPMGGGDYNKIILDLKEAACKGYWMCLKNLHLSISWLPMLEKEIKNIKQPHPRFKIFFTSESHNLFSSILLQNCLKVTFETPPGIKKNLERIYQIWSNSLFKEHSSLDKLTMQSLFAIAFIHALLQERRTYIPQGWSKFYEFSYNDLKVSAETIVEYLKNVSTGTSSNYKIIWQNIRGLLINSFYGGRIDNDFDFNIMKTYINKIFDYDLLNNPGSLIFDKVPIILSDKIDKYLELIKKIIPDADDPELFGLPLNVDRSVQRYVSKQVLSKLNTIYAISSNSLKFDKTEWCEKISPIMNIWKNIYNSINLDSMNLNSAKINNRTDPINIFIRSETLLLIDLSKVIESSFCGIESALYSNGLMTSKVMKDCLCLLQNRVPESWVNIWDGPELFYNYIKAIGKKLIGFTTKYIKYAVNDNLLENSIDLSEMIHPEAFIISLRQKSARKIKTPIDQMIISCDFNSNISNNDSRTSAKISGLFLQGAEFDGKRLIETKGNKSEILKLPIMNLYWINSSNSIIDENSTEIPVYENSFRENFICKLRMSSSGDANIAILKGIAICLDS